MPELTITFVDRVSSDPSNRQRIRDMAQFDGFKQIVLDQALNLFRDLLFTTAEIAVVSGRWVMPPCPPDQQDLVIHWVPAMAQSYLKQKMNGVVFDHRDAGGHTHVSGNTAGSEIYRLIWGHQHHSTARELAVTAAHEAMHNIIGNHNVQLHGRGGLAGDQNGHYDPYTVTITDDNRNLVQGFLNQIPNQLV
jgi:hypothetical protein